MLEQIINKSLELYKKEFLAQEKYCSSHVFHEKYANGGIGRMSEDFKVFISTQIRKAYQEGFAEARNMFDPMAPK